MAHEEWIDKKKKVVETTNTVASANGAQTGSNNS